MRKIIRENFNIFKEELDKLKIERKFINTFLRTSEIPKYDKNNKWLCKIAEEMKIFLTELEQSNFRFKISEKDGSRSIKIPNCIIKEESFLKESFGITIPKTLYGNSKKIYYKQNDLIKSFVDSFSLTLRPDEAAEVLQLIKLASKRLIFMSLLWKKEGTRKIIDSKLFHFYFQSGYSSSIKDDFLPAKTLDEANWLFDVYNDLIFGCSQIDYRDYHVNKNLKTAVSSINFSGTNGIKLFEAISENIIKNHNTIFVKDRIASALESNKFVTAKDKKIIKLSFL